MADFKEKIAYLSDLEGQSVVPPSAVQDNLPAFAENGKLKDTGKSLNDFYEKNAVDQQISYAVNAAEQLVKDEYTLASYKSDDWESGKEYSEGDFCQHGGKGYRCVEDHTSGAGFAPTKWQLVMSAAGKVAIDAVLSPYSGEDKARLLDMCSAYNSSRDYVAGQMVLKNGILKVCTKAGRGAGAIFADGTVDDAIAGRVAAHAGNTNIHVTAEEKTAWSNKQDAIADLTTIRSDAEAGKNAAGRDKIVIGEGNTITASKADGANQVELAKKSDIPTTVSQLTNDEGFAKSSAIPTKVSQLTNDEGYLKEHQDISYKANQSAIDAEYDTSDKEYNVGDTCTHEGKFYVCKRRVLQDADWNGDDWTESSLMKYAKEGGMQHQSDWTETDSNSPSYIKNKPDIPSSLVIDNTLTNEGQSAEAKATGDALAKKIDSSSIDDEYSKTKGYSVGNTCVHDGIWYRCTLAVTAGTDWDEDYWEKIKLADDLKNGEFQKQADWTEEDSSSPSFIKNKPNIPSSAVIDNTLTHEGQAADAKETGDAIAGRMASSAVDYRYDSLKSYNVGDTCVYDGIWYTCTTPVASRTGWVPASWEKIWLGPAIKNCEFQKQADWNEEDSSSPAYIKNKPNISGIPIDDSLPYKIVNLLPTGSTSTNYIPFDLVDHAINVIEGNDGNALSVASGKSIRLNPPSSPSSGEEGVVLAIDFMVVFNVTSDSDVTVSVSGLALQDYDGASASVVAYTGKRVVYRFTQIARSGSVFLVTLQADPSWVAVKEIDRALDALLADGGLIDFTP